MDYDGRRSSKTRTRNVNCIALIAMLIQMQLLLTGVSADGCFFPVELQGAYVTQQTSSIIADAFSTAEAAAAARAAATTAGPEAAQVRYSTVNVTADAIPIWGQCHRRIGHNVILQIDSDASECYRCVQLRLMARNVLRVRTERDFLAKCYTNEAKALAKCPGASDAVAVAVASPEMDDYEAVDGEEYDMDEMEEWANGDDYDMLDGEQTETILYKIFDFDGQPFRPEFCPFDGRYRATYNVHDAEDDGVIGTSAGRNSMECAGGETQLDNCPSGAELNLRFRGCSFEDHDVLFECLGHWIGANGQRYVALMNADHQQQQQALNGAAAVSSQAGPLYRCATYTMGSSAVPTSANSQQPAAHLLLGTARSYTISFSNDSTCSGLANLNNHSAASSPSASGRSETLQLFAAAAPRWPHQIFCSYPDWMRGRWQHMDVDQSTVVFRDVHSMKTYTMRCVENEIGSERFLVVSRTQCGEETYRCVWATQRSGDVLEFQIGARTAQNVTMDICEDRHFGADRWQTQARLAATLMRSRPAGGDKSAAQKQRRRRLRPVEPCPVRGEFAGRIPDAEGLCARLVSECAGSPDRMHYVVSECGAAGVVYEERQYKCLGQWQEAGLVYTYAQRTDVHQHQFECFVGGLHNGTEGKGGEPSATLFIKEAGEHCQRHVDPYQYGMELQQTGYCSGASSTVTTKQDRNGGGGRLAEVQPTAIGRPDSAPMVPILVHTNSRHNVLAMAAAAAAAEAAAADSMGNVLTNAVDLQPDSAESSPDTQHVGGVLLDVAIRRKPPAVNAPKSQSPNDDPLEGSRPRTISQWDFDDSMNALGAGTLEATKPPPSAAKRWQGSALGILMAAGAVMIVLRLSG